MEVPSIMNFAFSNQAVKMPSIFTALLESAHIHSLDFYNFQFRKNMMHTFG